MRLSPLLMGMPVFAGTTSFSAAASSPTDGQIHDVIERIIAEEAGSDIECCVSRLDLDADGADEVLFRFPVGAHGSQTRVIEWSVVKRKSCSTKAAAPRLPDLSA